MDYIKDVFLGQVRTDNSDCLNEASQLLDCWKTVSDIDALKDLGSSRPLLKVSTRFFFINIKTFVQDVIH